MAKHRTDGEAWRADEADGYVEEAVARLVRLLLGFVTANPVLQGLIASGLSVVLSWLSGHTD